MQYYMREGHKYMREVKDFFKKFEDASSPLYSDYDAMPSDEVPIVEKGKIDTAPTMQNALKPKDRGVLDIITDTIGPGYEPGRVGQVEEATLIKKQTNKKA